MQIFPTNTVDIKRFYAWVRGSITTSPSLLAELKQVANLKSAECEDDPPKMILQTYIDIYINIQIYIYALHRV